MMGVGTRLEQQAKAIELMKEQKYDEAARLFNEFIENNPTDPVGYVNFGNLLMHMHEYDRAIRFFKKALELDERTGTAYYGLGNAYFEQEKYKEAQHEFQRAITNRLRVSDVYFMLGLSFQYQDANTLSLPYLLRAVELEPDEEKEFQFGLALAQEELLEEAKEMFDKVLSRNKEHSDAHYNLGVIALYDQDVETSMYHFEEALTYQPDHALAANGIEQLQSFMDGEQ